MIPAIIAALGLAGLIGAGAYYVFTHWDEVLDWFRGFLLPNIAKLMRAVAKQFGPAAEISTEVIASFFDSQTAQLEHHMYTNENGQWTDTQTICKTPISQLPPRARKRIRRVGDELDITDEMENQLGMRI